MTALVYRHVAWPTIDDRHGDGSAVFDQLTSILQVWPTLRSGKPLPVVSTDTPNVRSPHGRKWTAEHNQRSASENSVD